MTNPGPTVPRPLSGSQTISHGIPKQVTWAPPKGHFSVPHSHLSHPGRFSPLDEPEPLRRFLAATRLKASQRPYRDSEMRTPGGRQWKDGRPVVLRRSTLKVISVVSGIGVNVLTPSTNSSCSPEQFCAERFTGSSNC